MLLHQQQFRLLVQSVTDYAIYIVDTGGRVSSWNVGAERIKGYRPHEVIGQHFSLFYTEEDRANGEPEKSLALAMREGRAEMEGWRVRKDVMNTAAMLEELGHTVIEAYSAKQALDALRADPSIELLITDQAMPQMTGVQLAEIVRREFPGLPIVLATGYAELPAGPDLGLIKLGKPLLEQDLARVICRVLDRQKTPDVPAPAG